MKALSSTAYDPTAIAETTTIEDRLSEKTTVLEEIEDRFIYWL